MSDRIIDLLEKAESIAFHMQDYEKSYKQYAWEAKTKIDCNYGYRLFALFLAAKTGLFDSVPAITCTSYDIAFNHPERRWFSITYDCSCNSSSNYILKYKNKDLINMRPWEIDRDLEEITCCIEETIQYVTQEFEKYLKH